MAKDIHFKSGGYRIDNTLLDLESALQYLQDNYELNYREAQEYLTKIEQE